MYQGDRRVPLPGLTALRFLAASYVLLYHLFPLTGEALVHPGLGQRLLSAGFTGVSCFFVLSGFILAYTHPRVPRPGEFYWARFARVYPLYLVALLLALPNFVHTTLRFGPRSQLWALPADLLLVQSWIPPLALAVNTPAWTLSTEAFFYALFPLLIGHRWLRPRRPLPLLLVLWGLQVLPALVAERYIVPRGVPALTALTYSVLFTPVFRLGEFVAGVVLGLAFVGHQEALAVDGGPSRARLAAGPWLLPLSLLACFGFLSLNLTLPHLIVRNGLLLGPFCLLIWALATTPSRLLASRPLQIGGEISYGVYVLQEPVSRVLFSLFSRTPWGDVHGRLRMLLLFPVAWLAYLAVEKPCRRWLLRLRPATRRESGPKPIPTPQTDLP